MAHNEDTRVKIPALLHLTQLGYKYLSLKDRLKNENCKFDKETNIHIPTFHTKFNEINQTQITIDHCKDIIKVIRNSLDSELGRSFYEILIKGYNGQKLIDFSKDDKNIYQIATELPYYSNQDEFRPDITLFINGIPIAFIEVKKPNNKNGIQAEYERMIKRGNNINFRHFLNLFQIMLFSNNLPYDDGESIPIQGAFYATTAENEVILNRFKEELREKLIVAPLDKQIEEFILKDTNYPSIKGTQEYQDNISPDTPTNQAISSLFSKDRLKTLLLYGITYVEKTLQGGAKRLEKHIMRYPQFFAMQAIKEKLDLGVKRGIIWHTQGSGKTALAYYNTRFLKDYFQKKGFITQFYFIVDRIDLAKQSANEFRSRGLFVEMIENKEEFEKYLNNAGIGQSSGQDSIVVVNIQKFSDKSLVQASSYNVNIQRIYFIDEAHRSYNPSGSFLSNLINSDKNAIKIALTGTPLIGVVYDKEGKPIGGKSYDSKSIFGDYIHKYYYNQSIADHYTLRLIREEISTTYKENLRSVLQELQIKQGSFDRNHLFSHPSYVTKLVDYILNDFAQNQRENIGAMVVCDSSEQAREIFREFETRNIKSALILHDNATKEQRDSWRDAFKRGELDFLIVYNMLLTGFDAPRLKRLYLGRVIKEHSLLQTLTRVNRPYKNFTYGYVIDFADISKEFDKTNQAYFNELQNELGDAFCEYSSIFKTQTEIEKDLQMIQDILFAYSTSNAEEFCRQILAIKDKNELIQISKAIKLYKELYNVAKLFGYDEIAYLFNLSKVYELHNEVRNRIGILNDKETLENASDMEAILNLALEDFTFKFIKIKEHELALSDKYRNILIKAQKELQKSQDVKDEQYLSLREELKRILEKKNIEELDSKEMQEQIKDLTRIYEKTYAQNQKDLAITNQYDGDTKFMRVHKRIKEGNSSINQTQLKEFLLNIKYNIDNALLDNEALIDNAAYFQGSIKQIIKNTNTQLEINPRNNIISWIANEYQTERIFA